ncbi:MAG: MurR/RpiR family transcriptional regulator [Microbacteriaceae bacterium]
MNSELCPPDSPISTTADEESHRSKPEISGGFGSAIALIRAYAGTLGPREGAVAAVILSRPQEITQWSTQELAQAAGTSAATVVRACRSLGFRGFQHLRLELARESAPDGALPDDRVSLVFDSARESLRVGGESVDREAVSEAAVLLSGARRVLFAANGFSAPPLQDAALRFATLGRPIEAPLDILAQQFTARTLGRGDVVLALTHSGANTHTLASCRAAKAHGATVIAVCSYTRAPIPELADIVISTGSVGVRHAVDPFFVRLNHSVVMHALLSETEPLLIVPQGEQLDMREVVAEALTDAPDVEGGEKATPVVVPKNL